MERKDMNEEDEEERKKRREEGGKYSFFIPVRLKENCFTLTVCDIIDPSVSLFTSAPRGKQHRDKQEEKHKQLTYTQIKGAFHWLLLYPKRGGVDLPQCIIFNK